MKKYGRWIIFGLVAVGLIILIILVGVNKELRRKIATLLSEKFIRNSVKDLEEEAAHAQAQAQAGKIQAEEAEKIAKETKEVISKQKERLQEKYKSQGMSADEISDRFNNLSI